MLIRNRPAVAIALLVAALSVLVASPALAGVATWTAPVPLSAQLRDAIQPQVTVDSTGRAIAIWARQNTSFHYIIQSSTSLNGGAWTSATDLSLAGGSAGSPQIVVDSAGRATAVWTRYDGANLRIQSSTFPNGGAWSTPVDLSTSGQHAEQPQVTVDSAGRATAVWLRSDGTNTIIQSSTSLNGATWVPAPADLSVGGFTAYEPHVTADPFGRATAVWVLNNGTNTIIQSSTSLGAGWSAPIDLTAGGLDAAGPQVTADSTGRATAIWSRSDGTSDIIQSRASVNGGPWSTIPANLSLPGSAGNNAVSPQIAVDSAGRATAVWTRYIAFSPVIQSSTSVNGGPWSTTPVTVSAAGQPVSEAQVTVDSTGLATAVWLYNYTGILNIVQSSTSRDGAAWTAPVDLTAAGQGANTARVTADSTGRVTAIWQRSDGANQIIQSSTAFTPPPPKPTLAATGTDATTLGLVAGGGALLVLTGLLVVIGSRRRTTRR